MRQLFHISIGVILSISSISADYTWEHFFLDMQTGGGDLLQQKVITFDSASHKVWTATHSIEIATNSIQEYTPPTSMQPQCLFVDDTGALWQSGVWSGVKSFYQGVKTIHIWDTTNAGISQVIQDKLGDFWYLLVFGVGVYSFDGTTHTKESSFDAQIIRTDQQGDIWLANAQSIQHHTDSGWENIAIPPLISKEFGISDMVIAQDGTLWIAIHGFAPDKDSIGGILHYTPDGTWTHLTVEDGLTNNYTLSVALDSSNNLWIGTIGGLSCYNGSIFTNWYGPDWGIDTLDRYQGNRVDALCVDEQNAIWIATLGVHCLKGFSSQPTSVTTSKRNPNLTQKLTLSRHNNSLTASISCNKAFENYSLKITAISGRVVFEKKGVLNSVGATSLYLNNTYASGIYSLQLQTNTQSFTTQFIIP